MTGLRFAPSMLRRDIGTSIIIIAVLAVGIGASTAIFSLFNAILLRRLPVRQPEQLVQLVQQFSPKYPPNSNFAYTFYRALRAHASTLRVITVSGGIAVVVAAKLAGSTMRSVLYGISPGDPFSFAAAGVFVALIASAATGAPLLKATRIQPVVAMRLDK